MSPSSSSLEETGVIICGGGPTGTALSVLLGALKVPNIVLEKEKDITTDPRGIALDEDGIRILQSIGIYDQIYTAIGTCEQGLTRLGEAFHLLTSPQVWASSTSSRAARRTCTKGH